jgi:hypothetical protein
MLFIALQPNGHNDAAGKVADLTLTYHLPGSGQTVTQTVTLAYPNNPTETPDPPYLSAPEMAVRYAIYNTYLGFRLATKSQPYQATSVLQNVRAAAVAWNQTHEDPDIAADIALIDQYLANLANTGYGSDYPPAGAEWDDPNGGHGPNYGVGSDYHGACNAGGSPRGLLLIAAALLFVVRRRR